MSVFLVYRSAEDVVFSQSMSEPGEKKRERWKKRNGKILPQFKHTLKLNSPKEVFWNWFFLTRIRRNQIYTSETLPI